MNMKDKKANSLIVDKKFYWSRSGGLQTFHHEEAHWVLQHCSLGQSKEILELDI